MIMPLSVSTNSRKIIYFNKFSKAVARTYEIKICESTFIVYFM